MLYTSLQQQRHLRHPPVSIIQSCLYVCPNSPQRGYRGGMNLNAIHKNFSSADSQGLLIWDMMLLGAAQFRPELKTPFLFWLNLVWHLRQLELVTQMSLSMCFVINVLCNTNQKFLESFNICDIINIWTINLLHPIRFILVILSYWEQWTLLSRCSRVSRLILSSGYHPCWVSHGLPMGFR